MHCCHVRFKVLFVMIQFSTKMTDNSLATLLLTRETKLMSLVYKHVSLAHIRNHA